MRGHVALVTGANRGIGRAIAEAFSVLGMTVLVGARRVADGEAVAGELSSSAGTAAALALDCCLNVLARVQAVSGKWR